MLLAKSGKDNNPRTLLLQLTSYEAIAENKISAEVSIFGFFFISGDKDLIFYSTNPRLSWK